MIHRSGFAMPSLSRFLTAALSLAAMRGLAFAGPPFITDDPEPVELHHWEVYIASAHSRQLDTYSGTLPHLEVNYGALPNVQLHVIAPMAYTAGTGQPFEYGYGDTELGFKFRFLQEKKNQPMAGIFPLVEVPTGDEKRGLGLGRPAVFLPLWLQKSYGTWTLYGGGGFWHNPGEGNRDYWFQGLTAQCQTTKSLMLGLEVFHTTPQSVGQADTIGFNVGGQYDFDEGHHLMLSVGTGFQGQDHGTAYIAYQWTFGPREKEGKGAAP